MWLQMKIVKNSCGEEWVTIDWGRRHPNGIYVSKLERFTAHRLRILAVDILALAFLGGWSAVNHGKYGSAYAATFWTALILSVLAARGVGFNRTTVAVYDTSTPISFALREHFICIGGIVALLALNVVRTLVAL